MSFISKEEIKNYIEKNGKYWIVFTGDSITSCEWVHPNWRDIVVYVLQNEITRYLKGDWQTSEWGIKGLNFAYDGATTKDIFDKIDDILLVKPTLVISLMGGNDPTLGVSVEESIKNIKEIAKEVYSIGTKLVWSSSTSAGKDSKKNLEYEPYSDAFMNADLGEVIKVDMFNIYSKFATDKFFTFTSEENPVEGIKKGEPDLIHPNQLGNAYISKVILDNVFEISFDPEIYIKDTFQGKKYPRY